MKDSQLKTNLLNIFNILEIKSTNNLPFINACGSNFRDKEDGFQYHIALDKGNIDYFVTANIRDFTMVFTSFLPVVTPLQMLTYLQ